MCKGKTMSIAGLLPSADTASKRRLDERRCAVVLLPNREGNVSIIANTPRPDATRLAVPQLVAKLEGAVGCACCAGALHGIEAVSHGILVQEGFSSQFVF